MDYGVLARERESFLKIRKRAEIFLNAAQANRLSKHRLFSGSDPRAVA
jgi:hypothetical protein